MDNSFGTDAINLITAGAEKQLPVGIPASGEMVAVTYKITLPANTDRLYCMVGWTGAASGTVVVSDVGFYKAT